MATIITSLGGYFQVGETLAANDAIYIDSGDNKIYLFDVTDDTQVFAGFAKEAAVLDDYIFVHQSGRVKGFVGLTPGAFVYASTTVPGSFQLVEPGATQKVVLGIAKSATELTINGGLGIKPGGDGGAGGGLDTFYTENMEGLSDTADFATGNNAAFMGGGTIQGALVVESGSPISGTKSLSYTQAAGSLNDYFASEIIELDEKQQENTSGMNLYFTYNGNDNDMRFVVYDVTNSLEIASEVNFVKTASKATRYSLSFYVPATCTQIRWGAQVEVLNNGKILVIDDVEMSTDPFHEADVLEVQTARLSTFSSSSPVTATAISHFTTIDFNTNNGLFRVDTDITLGTRITALRKCSIVANWNGSFGTAQDAGWSLNSNQLTTALNAITVSHRKSLTRFAGSEPTMAIVETVMEEGDILRPHNGNSGSRAGTPSDFFLEITATASTSHVLLPSDTFSTDTASLVYAGSATYTLATLPNAPIGTFLTYTYASGGNVPTQTNAAAPTQTTSSMSTNGFQLFGRARNATSTSASPCRFDINVGKGYKGVTCLGFGGLAKTAEVINNYWTDTTVLYGYSATYCPSTGILTLNAGMDQAGGSTSYRSIDIKDGTVYTSTYVTVDAGKTLPLLAVPTPLVAYLKDVKTAGVQGGTFTSGAWQTRTLNTVSGDSSIVTLSANQFTLQAGKYEFIASCPAYGVNTNNARLRNITDSSTTLEGTTVYLNAADNTWGRSEVIGLVTLTSAKTFEVQHSCQSTLANAGFGQVGVSIAGNEVYTQVTIKKIG